jgi:hypothetical protein
VPVTQQGHQKHPTDSSQRQGQGQEQAETVRTSRMGQTVAVAVAQGQGRSANLARRSRTGQRRRAQQGQQQQRAEGRGLVHRNLQNLQNLQSQRLPGPAVRGRGRQPGRCRRGRRGMAVRRAPAVRGPPPHAAAASRQGQRRGGPGCVLLAGGRWREGPRHRNTSACPRISS